VAVTRVDVSTLSPTEQDEAIEAAATKHHASFDLAASRLIQAVLFELGADRPSRLLLIVHHLAVDVVSWAILLEDFSTACKQLLSGEPISLPAKTTAYKHWADRLLDYSKVETRIEVLAR
jgi:hypothetical protein